MASIFVVGPGRSGTSVLLSGLRSVTGLPGHGEGHFFPIYMRLAKAAGEYYDMKSHALGTDKHMIGTISLQDVERGLIEHVKSYFDAAYGGGDFIDKSPGKTSIIALPSVRRAWPDAKIIFARRRGIEVIRSSVKKFTHLDFEGHCRTWAGCMSSWARVRTRLKSGFLEVDQYDLAFRPEETGVQIGEFLDLDQAATDRLVEIFKTQRPQATGYQETSISLKETGWSDDQIAIFRRECAKMMTAFGYAEGPEYWA